MDKWHLWFRGGVRRFLSAYSRIVSHSKKQAICMLRFVTIPWLPFMFVLWTSALRGLELWSIVHGFVGVLCQFIHVIIHLVTFAVFFDKREIVRLCVFKLAVHTALFRSFDPDSRWRTTEDSCGCLRMNNWLITDQIRVISFVQCERPLCTLRWASNRPLKCH